ncbi:MAG: LytTR family transcriptional regulator DNA-binding domain-containing protein [Rhodospirillum sp.]|nr:LytTR family transcriptional regulator DNA-binding domain-containing protein [Rhodospirillum sp.]MCF8490171.1 LytTR family transcriptional regulator DNA-binding domain-containing protein [Rhodospirillum sp.]
MALVDAHGINGLRGPSLGSDFWMVVMPLGWFQCLLSLWSMTALLGGTRLPGVMIVLGGALLVSLPLTLEARLLAGLLDPDVPFTAPLEQTFGACLAICLAFNTIAWGAVERCSFGPPPCSWTMLGAGGPGAEVDMNAAMDRLGEHLSRKRAESPAPALPFHPPVPVTPPSRPARPSEGPPPSTASESPHPPVLRLRRMPEGLLGTILCIEMEDHYLRVHTNQGQGMVLGRLRDVERELGVEAGMKVHRSWWVARAEVVGSEREGRNLTLLLSNGMGVPVSRANQPKVADAGWLDP